MWFKYYLLAHYVGQSKTARRAEAYKLLNSAQSKTSPDQPTLSTPPLRARLTVTILGIFDVADLN